MTNAPVTAFSFGCAGIGNLSGVVSNADAPAVRQNAWSAGIRYSDISLHHGRSLSEARLDGYLQTQPRDAYVVSTKVGRVLPLDKPTARPGPSETAMVADPTFRLKNEDGGILQISHDIHDVFDPCDRVIALNKTRNVGAFWIEDVKTDHIPSLITKGTLPDSGTPRGEKT